MEYALIYGLAIITFIVVIVLAVWNLLTSRPAERLGRIEAARARFRERQFRRPAHARR